MCILSYLSFFDRYFNTPHLTDLSSVSGSATGSPTSGYTSATSPVSTTSHTTSASASSAAMGKVQYSYGSLVGAGVALVGAVVGAGLML